ncbi:MAG: DUF1615 domain-containing protein [Steroidobacteraceae bacterium]
MFSPRSILALCVLALCGCSGSPRHADEASLDPDVARARILAKLPPRIENPNGWAVDIFAAFDSLGIVASTDNICAVLAVGEQETGLRVDPPVPGMAGIARREMEARAASHKVPTLLLNAALALNSQDGRSYSARLDAARTEMELSELFEDFIGMVPLGKRLFAGWNPVHTAGPMPVSIAFAEQHAGRQRYPYTHTGSIRAEVFTRRGGLYFGIAHLLGFPTSYHAMLYRFADFNAGHYASRNAAFQSALSGLAKTRLALDGDLLLRGDAANQASKTELAVRPLSRRLRMSDAQIRADLEQGEKQAFERSRLHERLFELADEQRGSPAPRAMLPVTKLSSPKITRALTTEWFARRVNDRYARCLARGS